MRAPSDSEHALVTVGEWLAASGYELVTITPESHRRVVQRRLRAETPRDVFGWSLPFAPGLLPVHIVDALRVAGALDEAGELLASRIRFSSLAGQLYVHSAYPTDHEHAVFFGPDTYRFCRALEGRVARRVVDLCAGTGAGGLSVACESVTLADCNPLAVTYARVNAALARRTNVEFVVGDLFASIEGSADLVIANPPYIADERSRVYCHGGDELGTALTLRIVEESLPRLAPGGQLVIYTGTPIQNGIDPIKRALPQRLGALRWTYEELDPDVFGEELSNPAYAGVERIAVVLLTVTAPL